jgi:hypothetical protein
MTGTAAGAATGTAAGAATGTSAGAATGTAAGAATGTAARAWHSGRSTCRRPSEAGEYDTGTRDPVRGQPGIAYNVVTKATRGISRNTKRRMEIAVSREGHDQDTDQQQARSTPRSTGKAATSARTGG